MCMHFFIHVRRRPYGLKLFLSSLPLPATCCGTSRLPHAMAAHVSEKEHSLMRQWHDEGLGVKTIAKRLQRSTDTVSKHVFQKHGPGTKRPKGRPAAITPKVFKRMEKTYTKMIADAKAKTEVTVAKIKRRMRLKCSEKTISRALWSNGVNMRPLYEKPTITDADKACRKAWAEEHEGRSAKQWAKFPHAIIDNKVFQVYVDGKGRDMAARRRVRGAYRPRGAKVSQAGYTKPAKSLKTNTGARSAMITCAIGCGKVLMWHEVKGQWNGDAARSMYTGPLARALAKAYPAARGSWRIIEDNDPSGYKSRKGEAGKAEAGIVAVPLPPRSPDLNPLDYSVWAEINRRMRKQEAKWPARKRESRDAFLRRLRRTAMRLPAEYINKTMENLHQRVAQLKAAKGGHFSEGGRSST